MNGQQTTVASNEVQNGAVNLVSSGMAMSNPQDTPAYDQWRSTHMPYPVMSSQNPDHQHGYVHQFYPPISQNFGTQHMNEPPPNETSLYHTGNAFGSPNSQYGAQTINIFGGASTTDPSGHYAQPISPFNYFPSQQPAPAGGDFAAAWGNASIVNPAKPQMDAYRDQRYPGSYDMYNPGTGLGGGLRQIEQGVANLGMAANVQMSGSILDGQQPLHHAHMLESNVAPSAVSGGQPPSSGGARSWASIASKPAKNSPPSGLSSGNVSNGIGTVPKSKVSHLNNSVNSGGNNGGFGAMRYDSDQNTNRNNSSGHQPRAWSHAANRGGNAGRNSGGGGGYQNSRPPAQQHQHSDDGAEQVNGGPPPGLQEKDSAALELLRKEYANLNPSDFNMNTRGARFFVIKSYSEDDIHRSIKYRIWCSTEHGNKRLDNAYKEREGKGPIYLLYSVNGSGHFCGVAEMLSAVDYNTSAGVWAQDKWKGQLTVRWIYVKDVPNSQLRHIRLENNENKPVTNSRDTQEVPPEKGRLILGIVHRYKHSTSIFDDFSHYERRQQEEEDRRKEPNGKRGNAE